MGSIRFRAGTSQGLQLKKIKQLAAQSITASDPATDISIAGVTSLGGDLPYSVHCYNTGTFRASLVENGGADAHTAFAVPFDEAVHEFGEFDVDDGAPSLFAANDTIVLVTLTVTTDG